MSARPVQPRTQLSKEGEHQCEVGGLRLRVFDLEEPSEDAADQGGEPILMGGELSIERGQLIGREVPERPILQRLEIDPIGGGQRTVFMSILQSACIRKSL